MKKLQPVIKILLALLLIVAVIAIYKNGSSWLTSVEEYSWSLDPVKLAVSAAILTISLALTPSGWVIICRSMGSEIPTLSLFAAWYASQLGRYIPGKIWLFAGRAGFLKTRGMRAGRAGATTAYELFFTVAAVGFLVLVSALVSTDLFSSSAAGTAAITASATLLLVPLLHPVQKLVCRKRGIPEDSLPSTATALKVTGVYAILWILRGISLYLLLQGVGLHDLNPVRALAAAPLSWFAGYIVIVIPGGIGIREAAAAALAAPEAIAPAAVAIAGQRLFMALVEVLLALSISKKILNTVEDKCL